MWNLTSRGIRLYVESGPMILFNVNIGLQSIDLKLGCQIFDFQTCREAGFSFDTKDNITNRMAFLNRQYFISSYFKMTFTTSFTSFYQTFN